MQIKEELLKLADLQKIDSEIYRVRKDRDTDIPQSLAKYNAILEEKKAVLKQAEDALKQSLLKKKEKELELAAKEEGVKKAQAALYQLKSNTEYQAKLNEISSLKADISIYDEDVLKTIDLIEKNEASLKLAKQTFIEQEKSIKEDIAKVDARAKEIDATLSTLENKRAILKEAVNPEVLTKYDKLLQKKSGLAITAVVNNSCGSCHIQINHQKINEIRMYKDLALCDSCNRILYIPEEFEA